MIAHTYAHYRTRIYFRHFRKLGMTATAAWQLAKADILASIPRAKFYR